MIELDSIKSNNKQFCLHCNIKINKDNNSDWEAFCEDGITTQPICKDCDTKLNNIVRKNNKMEKG